MYPKAVFQDLSQEVKSRKRSKFISESIKRSLKEKRDQKLAAEYREAAEEIRRINQDFEGAINDGIN